MATDKKNQYFKQKDRDVEKEKNRYEEEKKNAKPVAKPPAPKKKIAKAPATFPVFSLIGIGLLGYGAYLASQGDDV
ncbi:MAG: hypothetical protein P8Y47_10745, partial [Alphaproteobacteria bacterium]